jgi:hypothetical protein
MLLATILTMGFATNLVSEREGGREREREVCVVFNVPRVFILLQDWYDSFLFPLRRY